MHKSNIGDCLVAMHVPAYALYGEMPRGHFPDELHIETIVARSSVHDWKIRPHRHRDLFQFFLIVQGGGTALVDGIEHRLGAANLILLPPMTVHGFNFEPGTSGWVASVPAMTMESAIGSDGPLRRSLSRPVVRVVEPPETDRLARVMTCALEEFAGREPGRGAALHNLAALITVGSARLLDRSVGSSPSAHAESAVVAQFLQQVEAGFRSHQPLAAYARRLGIGVPHLTRLCREALGYAALAIVHDRIMLEARRNLVYTAMTMAEISEALGLSDPAYFSRFFTARAGVRPTAFRTRARDHT